MATRLETIRRIRLEKLKKLRGLGIEPYPASSSKDHSHRDIVGNFTKFEGKTVNLAGRVMTWREHGKVVFADIADESGKLQLVLKQDVLSPTDRKRQTIGFSDLELLDVGDFIQAEGEIIKTRTGEISVLVKNLTLLSKTLRPLPEKWKGLKDREIIFRRRYLDLAINPERREMFRRKAKFWEINRLFMKEQGFMEVETPVLEHITGGADARPFVTHMNALNQNFYLRISTELYQKRLIGGGYEKIYTFGPNFRNEGFSEEHLPEYYQIEWYWAYADYRDNMKLVKKMLRHIADKVYGKTKFKKGGHEFDLADKWEKITYAEAIKDRLGIDIFNDSEAKMRQAIAGSGVLLTGAAGRQRLVDNLWKIVRKEIAGPAFLIDEPKFVSPLAKSKHGHPELTERFHVIIAGSELGNGYSELNDPLDQLERFRDQQKARDAGDEEAQMMDLDFVEMLEYGLPPTSGYAHSERLFWTLEGVSAREATLFPQMKYRLSKATKATYGLK